MDTGRTSFGTASDLLLQVASFIAAVPVALVVVLAGSALGAAGFLTAALLVICLAIFAARQRLVLFAGGLLAGLVGTVGLFLLLQAARPDF